MPPRRKQQPSSAAKFVKLFLLLALAFCFKLFLSWAVRTAGLVPTHRSALDDLAADTGLPGDTAEDTAADVAAGRDEPSDEAGEAAAAEDAADGGGPDGHARETPAQFVARHIQDNRVMIFSKSYCPYSMRGKDVMRRLVGEAAVAVVELDQRDDMVQLQDELQRVTGGRTVPRIFVDQAFIGGADDVSALEASGELDRLLREKGLAKGA